MLVDELLLLFFDVLLSTRFYELLTGVNFYPDCSLFLPPFVGYYASDEM